jgi:hypothetical protein
MRKERLVAGLCLDNDVAVVDAEAVADRAATVETENVDIVNCDGIAVELAVCSGLQHFEWEWL